MRLTEFVTPTIHMIVTGTDSAPMVAACWLVMSKGFDTTLMITPLKTAMTAAII